MESGARKRKASGVDGGGTKGGVNGEVKRCGVQIADSGEVVAGQFGMRMGLGDKGVILRAFD